MLSKFQPPSGAPAMLHANRHAVIIFHSRHCVHGRMRHRYRLSTSSLSSPPPVLQLLSVAACFNARIHGRRPHIAKSCRIGTSLVFSVSTFVVSTKLSKCSAWAELLVAAPQSCCSKFARAHMMAMGKVGSFRKRLFLLLEHVHISAVLRSS